MLGMVVPACIAFGITLLVKIFIIFDCPRESRWRIFREYDVGKFFWQPIVAAFAGAVGGMFLVTLPISHIAKQTYYYDRTIEMVNLADNYGISGYLFFGGGHIGSETYYDYYYQAPDGAKIRARIKGEGIPVYEEDRRDGVIFVYRSRPSPVAARWSFFDTYERYELHIPKGSIKNVGSYELDLK